MGVLRIDSEQIWGSSKALLHELLIHVMINTKNRKLEAEIDIAIKQNIAYFSIVSADQSEITEFRQAADIIVRKLRQKDQSNNYNLTSAIVLLEDLKYKLALR